MTKLMQTNPVELIPLDTIQKIRELEIESAEIEKAKKEVKARLLETMERMGIQSWEAADKSLQITYVPGSEVITLDSKMVKEQHRDVYDACAKVTTRNPSVRITVR